MKIITKNNQTIALTIKCHDLEDLIGVKEQSDYCLCDLEVNQEFGFIGTMLISDVEKLISWFGMLLESYSLLDTLQILDRQLYLEILKSEKNSKFVRITYDNTIPVPGMGAYSLPDGVKEEDAFQKRFVDCVLDDLQIKRFVRELKNSRKKR